MADDKLPVEREIIIATESVPADQKKLGGPMVMLIILIVAAIAAIGITVFVLSN